MILAEISLEYRAHAALLKDRITELEQIRQHSREGLECVVLDERIHMLSTMLREAQELAVLTARYYERGYRRNAKYTI